MAGPKTEARMDEMDGVLGDGMFMFPLPTS